MADIPMIRRLGPGDAASYRELRLAGLRDEPEAFGADFAAEAGQQLDWFAGRLASPPPAATFGAFRGEALAGCAGFVPMGESEKSRHKGLLVGMRVAPEHRRRGLGRALVAAVIAHARAHVLVLQAHVGAANLPACGLYESAGFRVFGIEPKALRIGERFVDEALMALDFTGNAAA